MFTKSSAQLAEMKLVGISIRTNNVDEMNQSKAKIGATVQKYFQNALAEKINNRKSTDRTMCVYTNYESDDKGDYTYFIGEEVTSFDKVEEGLETLVIPAQEYVKFTSNPGPMPVVCINMWKEIWNMYSGELRGERAYIADFEIYDERSRDPENTVLDVYIGVKNR